MRSAFGRIAVPATAILLLDAGLALAQAATEPEAPLTLASPASAGSPSPESPVPAPTPAAVPATTANQGSTPPKAADDPDAEFFLRTCSGCHTIGGGELTGPDLQKATQWSADDLHPAVRRMEKNVGPMTDEQVNGLVDLLKSPDLQSRLDAAKERRKIELTSSLEPGSPLLGGRLFFGQTHFANGGIACVACHSVASDGGNMAIDLTASHVRLGESSLISTIEQPSFPLMKAAYRTRPVTPQETMHLVAFLQKAGTGLPRDARPPAENVAAVHGTAAGLVAVVLGGVAFVFRSRRAGVRSRLLRDSLKR